MSVWSPSGGRLQSHPEIFAVWFVSHRPCLWLCSHLKPTKHQFFSLIQVIRWCRNQKRQHWSWAKPGLKMNERRLCRLFRGEFDWQASNSDKWLRACGLADCGSVKWALITAVLTALVLFVTPADCRCSTMEMSWTCCWFWTSVKAKNELCVRACVRVCVFVWRLHLLRVPWVTVVGIRNSFSTFKSGFFSRFIGSF